MIRLKSCLIVLLLGATAAAADVRQVALPTNDLIYNPATHLIYASVPSKAGALGNSIVAIEPTSGGVGAPVFIGSEPGRLALSDDGRYLYVALDGAAMVRRLDLVKRKADLTFSLGKGAFSGPFFVDDMKVLPGRPQSVAVARKNLTFDPRHEGVAIYDNGFPRLKATPSLIGSNVIAFGSSAARLYGLDTETSGAEFRRMALDDSGVTVLDALPSSGLGDDIRFDDGLIYGSSGRVLDPEARQVVGTFTGVAAPALVAPDSADRRVFFLTGKDQDVFRTLLAFHQPTFLPVGLLEIPDVIGRASSLILWGTDGLAFRTDGGQVYLVRTPLRGLETPSADLALAATAAPNPVAQGAPLTVTFTVTNRGPSPATGVTLTEALYAPEMDEIVSTTTTQGQCRATASQFRCDFGSLAVGASATATRVLKPGNIILWGLEARVTANEPDPIPDNNRITSTVRVIEPCGPADPGCVTPPVSEGIRVLSLSTKDLAYDPVTRKLYASVPSQAGAIGNSVIAIDPVTGAMDAPVFIGSEPGKLALSDDGRYLYVALDGAPAVRRIDMATQTAGAPFSLGSDPYFGPYSVEDMKVVPGSATALAIARQFQGVDPRHAGVAVYDIGVPRGKTTAPHTGSNVIQFATSLSRLYGYDDETTEFGFRRMTVDASGVTVDDVQENLISGFGVDVRFDQGLLFATSGRVIEPESGTLLGTLSGLGPGALIAPDVKARRVYALTGAGPTRQLVAFDPTTFLPIASLDIPGVMGRAGSLIRWSDHGLAFRTDQGQVFLIPTGLVAADDLTLTLKPASVTGSGVAFGIVTLDGPPPPAGAVVTLSSSNPAVAAVPASLTFTGAETIRSVPITVKPVTAPTDVVFSATYGRITRTVTLRLLPEPPPPKPEVLITFSPNNPPGPWHLVAGTSAVITITLATPAPAGGRSFSVQSDHPEIVSVPAQVVVPAGATTAPFTLSTRPDPHGAETILRITSGSFVIGVIIEVWPTPP